MSWKAEDEQKLRAFARNFNAQSPTHAPSVPAKEAFDRVERLLSELARR